MYGGSGKLGRGGGARGSGVGKRNVPPLNRPSAAAAAPGGRGGGGPRNNRNSVSGPTTTSSSIGAEETFSLVTGNPLNFAMLIRLAPDLVEEIKQVEAEGGTARIKLDTNANSSSGNVINVGNKDFRFTWSREMGDLCDIYEERRSGEDGNGLLVESGGAWRKLNVQRVLDESFTNNIKKKSEEAEKKHKSRKAIVLDHGNPSLKSQVKAMAAAEASPWKMSFKQKKEQPPFKKRKAEPPPGGDHRSAYKPGSSTTTYSKRNPSASPLSSPFEPSAAPASPFGNANLLKGQLAMDDVGPSQNMTKATGSDKENPSKVITVSSSQDKLGRKTHAGTTSTDLCATLVSLLMENQSKGLSLKTLEKAVGDMFPNSAKQIETIIKKIAIYQAPGRYFLKPGLDSESLTKSAPENGSSPEDHCQPSSAPDKHDQLPAPQPDLNFKTNSNELEEGALSDSKPREESDAVVKIDILHNSSSDSSSDSDSESESSDSGSRSRSKSAASGSSSDSESDASRNNSKEAPDEDVDIMSDDDKETNHNRQIGTLDFEPGQFAVGEIEDLNITDDVVEIEKDFPDGDRVAEMAVIPDSEKTLEEMRPLSSDWHEHKQSQVRTGKLEDLSYQKHYNEIGNIDKDRVNHEPSNSIQKVPKSKAKRARDEKHSADKADKSKRVKTQNAIQQQSSHFSPNKPSEGSKKGLNRDGAAEFSSQKSSNQEVPRKSASDFFQPDRRSFDFTSRGKGPTTTGFDRPSKPSESSGHAGKSSQDEYGFFSDKRERIIPKDGFGGQQRTSVNSKFSPNGNNNMVNTGKSPLMNGRGGHMLQRELSDLELGELREPPPQETAGLNKQFERKSSFKAENNKPTSSDYWNFESSKVLPPQQPRPRVNQNVSGSQYNQPVEVHSSKQNEVDGSRKLSVGAREQHDLKHGVVFPPLAKENKGQKSSSAAELNDRHKDESRQRMRESSPDELSSYTKYEKEEPELKGPIENLSHYDEYVQEYLEKYNSYCSINKILESYRNEFSKLGKELEVSKGRDAQRFYDMLGQLKDSYHKCGPTHKRLKKIFIVLHEELKHLKQAMNDFAVSYGRDR